MQIFRCRKLPLVTAFRQRRFVECRPDAREERELHVAIEFERALGLVLDRLHDLGLIVIGIECCGDIRCDRAQYNDHCEQWPNDKPDDFSHCRFAFRAIGDPRSNKTHGPAQLYGAGEGNRTLVCSLGSCRSTIELHPPYAGFYRETRKRNDHRGAEATFDSNLQNYLPMAYNAY